MIIRQIEFAGSMSPRQWAMLEALSAFSFPLCASEWIDAEITSSIRNGLAEFDPSTGDSASTIRWTASDVGANLVQLKEEIASWPDFQSQAHRNA